MQSRKVPCRFGSVVHERGNISYQLLKRAFSRSTMTRSSFEYVVAAERSGYLAIRPASSPLRIISTADAIL